MRIAHHVKRPNYRTVWASLQEVSAMQKETDRMQKEDREQLKETARQMRETFQEIRESQKEAYELHKETEKTVNRTSEQIGKLGNRFGEAVEYMVVPNLLEKFRELGFNFLKANRNTAISDRKNNIFLEVDVMLENGDKALAVETKTNLTIEDIKEHIQRLEKLRAYADMHGDKRAFLGAVAGVVIKQNARDYALAQGFYVVEPSGETFNIIAPDGQPKEW